MTFATTLLLALFAVPGANPPADGPRILDFHTTWCGPCQQMRPVVQRLVDNGYPIQSIDGDQSRDLCRRYKITGYPTFIVVDAAGKELDRIMGVQPANDLARMYNDAVRDLPAEDTREAAEPAAVAAAPRAAAGDEDASELATTGSLPKPWKTGVRIKVLGQGAIGFGSGTIIRSTAQETIILTCAHLFKDDHRRKQYAPAEFPHKIQVDLFDGVLHGDHPKYVHPVETVDAQVIDYDFGTDVGLVRIKPGRVLEATNVVPPDWQPKQSLAMITVGCSQGRNASPWSTVITNPGFKATSGYQAIECNSAPMQGRSGGGLYTLDGYLAGVCNFAETSGDHGLYASPQSIYRLLDRNHLTLCYNPAVRESGQGMLAANGRPGATRTGTTVRAQNSRIPSSRIPMPDPERVGVKLPPLDADQARATEVASHDEAGARNAGWQAPGTVRRRPATQVMAGDETETTDLHIDRDASGVDEASSNPAVESVGGSAAAISGGGGWRARPAETMDRDN